MTKARSKKTSKNQLPLFIQKLVEMLDDEQIQDIISWTSSKDSFNIKNVSQFTQTILTRFFKHNNFSSFIRQLNMYGFKKIRHNDGENVYGNQNFIKGQDQLLKNIKRKINQDKQDKLALYNQQDDYKGRGYNFNGNGNGNGYPLRNNSAPNIILTRQVQEMKNKQKDLQQVCRHLLMQNQKLIQENSNLMRKMKEQSRQKQKKIEQLLIQFITSQQQSQKQLGNSSNQGQNTTTQNLSSIQTSPSTSTMKNMLSLMNQQNSSQLQMVNGNADSQTPLQILSNAISRNKNMKQMKQMFDNLYQNNPSSSIGSGGIDKGNDKGIDTDNFNKNKDKNGNNKNKYGKSKNYYYTIVSKDGQKLKQMESKDNQDQYQYEEKPRKIQSLNRQKQYLEDMGLDFDKDGLGLGFGPNNSSQKIEPEPNRVNIQNNGQNQALYNNSNAPADIDPYPDPDPYPDIQQNSLFNQNPIGVDVDHNDNSFLSINDFLNIDQNNNTYLNEQDINNSDMFKE